MGVASLSTCCLLALLLATVNASRGDSTLLYHRCVEWCAKRNCSSDDVDAFLEPSRVPWWLHLTGWSCKDDCRYKCMWLTVKAFRDDGLPVPQFHGKWPFIRILGIQEPVSAVASLLNFGAHSVMTVRFCRRVPHTAPLFRIWMLYSVFSMNAWLSSTIFHTKDTPLTEKMDYFGALSFMLCSLYACLARISLGTWNKSPPVIVPFLLVLFFFGHTSYLSIVHFDYKYNLIVNVGIGAISSILWLFWCLPRCRQHRYNRYGVVSIIALNVLVCLEVLDFPPLWWVLDAHALWHTGTILLAIPWYWFIIEDCRLLHSEASTFALLDEHRKVL